MKATLLQDADILEQLGAIGAMRALVKIGRDFRYDPFSSVLPVLRRAAEGLPGKLRLKNAQLLIEPRVQLLRSLLAAIEEEAGELLNQVYDRISSYQQWVPQIPHWEPGIPRYSIATDKITTP